MANQTQELLTPIKSYDITNDDVQKTGEYGEYYILITHNLDSLHPIVEWYLFFPISPHICTISLFLQLFVL